MYNFTIPLRYFLIAIAKNELLHEAPTQTPFAENIKQLITFISLL